jgi:hypothetical protein
MDENWPPPGHLFTSQVTVALEGQPPHTFELTTPGAVTEVDIAAVRIRRLGGPTSRDEAFRADLYRHLGALVVAGGHAEAAMKRVVIVSQERSGDFVEVDWNWTDLEKALNRVAAGDSALAAPLGQVLSWGADNEVKRRRDDAVHAYWWDFDIGQTMRGRFARRERGVMITGTIEDLQRDAEVVAEYAERLDELVQVTWPQGRLL